MHRLICVVLFFSVVALFSNNHRVYPRETKQSESPTEPYTLEEVIAAMIEVESEGRGDAIGDLTREHKSYGCLQVRQPAVDDYNKWNKTSYKAEDCLGNHTLSIAICMDYLAHYATPERLGRPPTSEDLVRIWNGGPNGHKKPETTGHWLKVEKALARHREQ